MEPESTFDRIVSRTRDNIDRINKKYSSAIATQPTYTSSIGNYTSSLASVGISESITSSPNRKSNNQPTAEAGSFNVILERLNKLERNHTAVESTASTVGSDSAQRIKELENTVSNLCKTVETLTNELKDSQRVQTQTNLKINRQSGIIDAIQQDVDSRRVLLSKMDIWAKQGEVWREDVEAQLVAITKQLKQSEKKSNEYDDTLQGRIDRSELDTFRDKMTLFTQQTVATSVAAWHDRIEENIRSMERQISVLKGENVDQTTKKDSKGAKSADGTPSELVIKSLITSEIKVLEERIEETINTRVNHTLKSEVSSFEKSLRNDMSNYMNKIASEIGLLPVDGEQVSQAQKVMEARRGVEKELERISSKVDDISEIIINMNDNNADKEKNLRVELRALERSIEDVVVISNNNVTTIQNRCGNLEELVRNSEMSLINTINSNKNDVLERLRESCESWLSDRASLDRRIVITERIGEDISERIKLASSAIDIYFAASPLIKRFENTATKCDLMYTDFNNFKQDTTVMSHQLAKLNSIAATNTDISELRERVAYLEPIVDQCVDSTSSIPTMDKDLNTVRDTIVKLESSTTNLSKSLLTDNKNLESKYEQLLHDLKELTTMYNADIPELKKSSQDNTTAIETTSIKADVLLLKNKVDVNHNTISMLQSEIEQVNKKVAAMSVVASTPANEVPITKASSAIATEKIVLPSSIKAETPIENVKQSENKKTEVVPPTKPTEVVTSAKHVEVPRRKSEVAQRIQELNSKISLVTSDSGKGTIASDSGKGTIASDSDKGTIASDSDKGTSNKETKEEVKAPVVAEAPVSPISNEADDVQEFSIEESPPKVTITANKNEKVTLLGSETPIASPVPPVTKGLVDDFDSSSSDNDEDDDKIIEVNNESTSSSGVKVNKALPAIPILAIPTKSTEDDSTVAPENISVATVTNPSSPVEVKSTKPVEVASPPKPEKAAVATPVSTTTSTTTPTSMTMKERLKLRQENLLAEKKNQSSTPQPPVKPTKK